MCFSPQGTTLDAMKSIDSSVLNTEHGLEGLIRLLDAVYLKDSATQAYCAFRGFVEYRRSSVEFNVFAVFASLLCSLSNLKNGTEIWKNMI